MILEFKIKNFLSFKDEQTISFEATSDKTLEDYFVSEIKPGIKVLKFGVIYGPNASGKTNLLSAFDFVRHMALTSRKADQKTGFIPFLFDSKTKKSAGEFEITFLIESTKYRYLLKVNETKVVFENLFYYPKGQPVEIFYRNLEEKILKFGTHSDVAPMKKYRDALETNTLENMTLLSALQITNVQFPVLLNVFVWFKLMTFPIIEPKTGIDLQNWTTKKITESPKCKQWILDLLKKADFSINDLRIDNSEIPMTDELKESLINSKDIPEKVKDDFLIKGTLQRNDLYFQHDIPDATTNTELDSEVESAGTIRLYSFGGPLYELIVNNKVLIIDEIESSLHPDLVNYFINAFLANSKQGQLLVTTHNLSIMAEADEIRRDVIWFTDKRKDGSTELYSLSDFKTSDIRKGKGMSYLKAYKAGKFGALPNLGSIFIKEN